MPPNDDSMDRPRDHVGQGFSGGSLVPQDWLLGPYHLLAIGIDEYAHWGRLMTARAGAEAVRETLTNEFGFEPDRCIVLRNHEATGEAIIAALRSLARTLSEEASLLIYFAGHGHIDDLTQLGWWIPVDGQRPATESEIEAGRDHTRTWISNHEIKTVLARMKARHVLLVSDSCYSGDFVRAMTEARPVTDEYVKTALLRTSRHALTSGGLHPVQDDGFNGQSVFTHFFLKALKDRTMRWFTANRLHERVVDGVLANARQMPAVGVVRDTGGELSGEFVLVRPEAVDLEQRLEERSAELKALEEALERDRVAREAATREREKKEAALAALQERIEALKASQGGGVGVGGNWQQMKALLEAKKRQAEELRKLQQEQAEAARRRAEELERLEREERERCRKYFESEWAAYEGYLQDPDIPAEHHPDMWMTICAEFGVRPKSMTPGKLRWNGEGVVQVVKVEVAHLQILALLRHQAFVAPKGEGRGGIRFIPTNLQIETVSVFRTNIGMELLWIPPGKFLMGNSEGVGDGDECPQTEVTISRPFWMGKFPVRQRDWEAVMGSNPSHFKGKDRPVERVSWDECVEFGKRLTEGMKGKLPAGYEYRLPAEAEWEYACRAGTTTQWSFGDEESELKWYGWYDKNSRRQTHRVGQKQSNPWGLHDMHGGVWEWCLDRHRSYPGGAATRISGFVVRGGSWNSSAGECRSAYRGRNSPGDPRFRIGFRLVLAPRSGS